MTQSIEDELNELPTTLDDDHDHGGGGSGKRFSSSKSKTESLNESIVNALTLNAGKGCSNRNLMKYQQQQKSSRRFMMATSGLSTRRFHNSRNKSQRNNSISEEKATTTTNEDDYLYDDDDDDDASSGGAANLLDARHLFMLEAKKASKSTFHLSQFEQSMAALSLSPSGGSWQEETFEEEEEKEAELEDYEQSIVDDDKDDDKKKKKQVQHNTVSFTKVSIREYPIIVGDNPGGQKGVPVTIGWEKCNDIDTIVAIDQYENARVGYRRSTDTLRMSVSHRNDVLKKLGFSMKERQDGQKVATLIRKHRLKENLHEKQDHLYERLEGARRSLNHMLHPKRRKKDLDYIRTSLTISSQRSSINSRTSVNSVDYRSSSCGGGYNSDNDGAGSSSVDGDYNSDDDGSSSKRHSSGHQLHSILRHSITNQ